MRDVFLIVDGNSLMHRAFHALPLMDTGGVFTNAVHGFLGMLLRCLREKNPRYCAVAFDEHAPTFRHEQYAEYKAGRAATPDELRGQFDIIKEILRGMGLGVLSVMGYEADDILGTLAGMCRERGIGALLLTGDRDALQLVDEDTTLLLTRKGISEIEECTRQRVRELFMVTPEQVTDLKGLMGDSSDNIPGVPGVGEKTAVKLLAEYGTLEQVLASAGGIKGKLGERLRDNRELALFSKELATIRRTVPLTVRFDACETTGIARGVPLMRKYGLNAIAQRVLREAGETAQPVEPAAPEAVTSGDEPSANAVPATPFDKWQEITTPQSVAALLQPGCERAAYIGEDMLSIACGRRRAKAPLTGQTGLFDLPSTHINDPFAACDEVWRGDIITHDGKKLLHQLSKAGRPLPGIAFDTLLAAYLLNPQEKTYALSAFAQADASGVLSLSRRQLADMNELGVLRVYEDIELPLLRVLFDMEREGFMADRAVLREIGDKLLSRAEALREDIYSLSGTAGFNINSPKQLGEVLFTRMGLKAGRRTSTGYSTDAETLEGLLDEHPVIARILEYRQVSKLHGTYIDALIRKTDAQGRIHTFFDQTGTATGRISSAEPNLQNIPVRTPMGREIRRAFIAKPGHVLVDADYSQIELRILAHLSGDEAMRDAFIKQQDIHTRTAAAVNGTDMARVTPKMRSDAKAVNFGIVYGISDFGLARNTGMTRREAALFIQRYFDTYPGVKRFMAKAVADGYQTGCARTLFGRVRPLPELKAANANIRSFGERAAMNTPVQGTAADIIKLAMVHVHKALREGGFRAKLILQVHDELIIESPENEAGRVAELLQSCMENVAALAVPLTADVKIGSSWYDTK